jgi:hypothetical protein
MRFIQQKNNDDFLYACVCSLMEWSMDDVPNIDNVKKDHFFREFFKWINKKGYTVCCFKEFPAWGFPKNSIMIASGQSPYRKKGVLHAVLWQNGKLLFDPSQKGNKGIIGEPTEYYFLVRLFK